MEKYISKKEKASYGFAAVGSYMVAGITQSYLMYFFTDILIIPSSFVMMLMIVARIWDAVNDPMWGSFIDSRKPTKYGRFRPYILWASLPLAVGAFFMFFKIPGLSDNQYLIYAYITYIFYGMMYTGVNIPYGSLASVITDDEIERSSLSMWRSIGAGIGGLPASILLPLLVYTTVTAENGTTAKVLDGTKLSLSVAVLSVLTVIIFFLHFKLTKERITLPPTQNQKDYNLGKAMRALLKNKPFIALCIVSMLLICFQMYTQTVYNYLFKNFYEKPGLYALVTVCTYLPMVLLLPFMGKLIRKFGKKEICSAGILFALIVNIVMFLIRFTPAVSNPYVFLVLSFFSGAGQTFLIMEIWALVTDVTDYHEYISGRREEGTSYSFYSFARKLGQTVAGAGAAGVLGAIGYDGKLAVQSPEVLTRLYDIATIVPAILLALMFAVLTFGYKLSKEQLEELHKVLLERREKAEAETK